MPEKKVLISLNARNENDQQLFCRDLAEAIAECNEIESIKSKSELDKFKIQKPVFYNFTSITPDSYETINSTSSINNLNQSSSAMKTTNRYTKNSSSSSSNSTHSSYKISHNNNNTNNHNSSKTNNSGSITNSLSISSISSSGYLTKSSGSSLTSGLSLVSSPTLTTSSSSSCAAPLLDHQIKYKSESTLRKTIERENHINLKRTLSNSMLDLSISTSKLNEENYQCEELGTNLFRASSKFSILSAATGSNNEKLV
jgi:hypothetical protein